MKRLLIVLMLLFSALLLAGCSVAITPGNLAVSTMAPGTDPVTPLANASDTLRTDETVTLYFRYMDEPYLAAEHRAMSQLPTESWEYVLIHALISGPETRSNRLNGLFPEGTRLIATEHDGRTLHVTLSSEIMNDFPDEPSDWAADPYWAQEVPRRRSLCMQSLAATVVENSDVDRIQIFVQQPDGSVTRLPLSYYRHADDSTPAPMLTRDAGLLLNPDNTMHVILHAWLRRDWTTMYRYLSDEDSQAGGMDERAFVTAMENAPHLISYECSGGTVSVGGSTVTFTVYARVMDNRTEHTEEGVIRLHRDESLWTVTMTQLTGWLEE